MKCCQQDNKTWPLIRLPDLARTLKKIIGDGEVGSTMPMESDLWNPDWERFSRIIVPERRTAAAKSLQLCPTLCDSIDSSPPSLSVPGILQARTLEWVAISFSSQRCELPCIKREMSRIAIYTWYAALDTSIIITKLWQWRVFENPWIFENCLDIYGFLGGTHGKESICQCRRHKRHEFNPWVRDWMAIHSSILAWEIPWTEKPGGPQSMGLQRVRHDWATSLSLFLSFYWKMIDSDNIQCKCFSPRQDFYVDC